MKAEAGMYAVLAVGLAVLVACAGGPGEAIEQPVMAGIQAQPQPGQMVRTGGFLTAETMPNAVATIPPAPKEGEGRNDLDWKIFRETRALEGSDRWKLAQSDNSYLPKDLLKDFSCSVGAELTAENAPTLAAILGRTTIDAGAAAEAAKQLYKRTRPYMHNDGNICIEKSDALGKSFDYPSGHASLGWTAGLVMAQLAPDRASQVLARGRSYGESRVVCGVHNMSAIEAGRTNAAGVFAALQGSSAFVAAMAKAREEVAAARASGAKPDAAWCAKEAELIKPLVVE
jgi:acid phosphatase (class A)